MLVRLRSLSTRLLTPSQSSRCLLPTSAFGLLPSPNSFHPRGAAGQEVAQGNIQRVSAAELFQFDIHATADTLEFVVELLHLTQVSLAQRPRLGQQFAQVFEPLEE